MFSFFKKSDAAPAEPPEEPPDGWAARLKQGLARTRAQFGHKLAGLFGGGGKIDEALYEELETILLTSDVGVGATEYLLDDLRRRVKRDGLSEAAQLKTALQEAMLALLEPLQHPLAVAGHRPFIIMLAGVNGAGKTTTIGKLAKYFQSQGKSVLLAAGDTFPRRRTRAVDGVGASATASP